MADVKVYTDSEIDQIKCDFAFNFYKFARKELFGFGRCDVGMYKLFSDYLKLKQITDDDGIGGLQIQTGCNPLIVQ